MAVFPPPRVGACELASRARRELQCGQVSTVRGNLLPAPPLQVVEVLEAVNLVLADSGYSVLLGMVSADVT